MLEQNPKAKSNSNFWNNRYKFSQLSVTKYINNTNSSQKPNGLQISSSKPTVTRVLDTSFDLEIWQFLKQSWNSSSALKIVACFEKSPLRWILTTYVRVFVLPSTKIYLGPARMIQNRLRQLLGFNTKKSMCFGPRCFWSVMRIAPKHAEKFTWEQKRK